MVQSVVAVGARGGGITLIGSMGSLVIQAASLVILSRLLAPEDFGLVAMAGVFAGLATLLRDFGLPLASLQAEDLSHQQASNMFWMNSLLAGLAAALLALSAPVISHLFAEPRLVSVVPVLAVALLMSGVGAQLQVNLARRLRFAAIVFSDLLAQIVALALATVVALAGGAYWALVAQVVVVSVLTLTIRWVVSGWLPSRFRRGHGSIHLFRTGMQYGLALFLTYLQNNADSLVIGLRMGAGPLGLYSRGYQLLTAPAGKLLDPLTQVVIPTLNEARKEGRQAEHLLLRVQFVLGCGIVWMFSVAGGAGDLLVPLVLGDGWRETVQVFQILAVGGAIWIINYPSYWAFIAYHRSRQLLTYNLLSKPLSVVCIVCGSQFGITGVAWGYVAAMALSWPLSLLWLARCTTLRVLSFAKNGALIVATGAGGAVAAHLTLVHASRLATVQLIVLSMAAGTAVMIAVLCLVPSMRTQLVATVRLLKTVRTPATREI